MRVEIKGLTIEGGGVGGRTLRLDELTIELSGQESTLGIGDVVRGLAAPLRTLQQLPAAVGEPEGHRPSAVSRQLSHETITPPGGTIEPQRVTSRREPETERPARETSEKKTSPETALPSASSAPSALNPSGPAPPDDDDDEVRIGRVLEAWRDSAPEGGLIEASRLLSDPNDRQLARAMLERGDPVGLSWRKPSRWGPAAVARRSNRTTQPTTENRQPKTPAPAGRAKALPPVTSEQAREGVADLLQRLPRVGMSLVTQDTYRHSDQLRRAALVGARGDRRFNTYSDAQAQHVVERIRLKPDDPLEE